jgi:hypothetical protein
VFLHDPSNPPDPSPEPGVFNDYMLVDPTRSSYVVDKSRGVIRLRDFDRDPSNGLQLRLILPGTTTPVTVDATGRVVRALYQAKGEWALQVLKAPARFRLTYGVPQVAEYYVGGSGARPLRGSLPFRIYFPVTEIGKNVTIGEIKYFAARVQRVIADQNFAIQNGPWALGEPNWPYVDIRSLDPTADEFDFSDGYAVRFVRGASVEVRVLWNPEFFNLTTDTANNWERFVQWSRGWRRVRVETYLQRGEK